MEQLTKQADEYIDEYFNYSTHELKQNKGMLKREINQIVKEAFKKGTEFAMAVPDKE